MVPRAADRLLIVVSVLEGERGGGGSLQGFPRGGRACSVRCQRSANKFVNADVCAREGFLLLLGACLCFLFVTCSIIPPYFMTYFTQLFFIR